MKPAIRIQTVWKVERFHIKRLKTNVDSKHYLIEAIIDSIGIKVEETVLSLCGGDLIFRSIAGPYQT